MPNEANWLAQISEKPIDPELPIIDPHHHLWEHPVHRYMLEELRADTGGGHNVRQTVFIECMSSYRTSGPEAMKPVGETEFVRAVAQQSAQPSASGEAARIGAIVGFADLSLGDDVASVLEAHVEAGGGLFRGIRHASGWDASEQIRNSHTEPTQHLLSEPQFKRGFAMLERFGLSFDAWLYHPQIEQLDCLAAQFETTTIVLDHIGGPLGIGPYQDRANDVFEHWKPAIAKLAKRQNVVVKLGGLAMPVNGFGWHKRALPPGSEELAAAQAPYYEHVIECFGAERCMFESNFPVDRTSCSYTVLWNAFKRIAAPYSQSEQQALFHDTAQRVYRLTGRDNRSAPNR